MNEQIDALLMGWKDRARESQHSHYETAKLLRFMDYALGLPVIIVLTLFASLFSSGEECWIDGSWAAVLSVFVAILASLQTFLKLGEKAVGHKDAGADFGALRRMIEQLITRNYTEAVGFSEIDNIRVQVDRTARIHPNVPSVVWWYTRRKLRHVKGE